MFKYALIILSAVFLIQLAPLSSVSAAPTDNVAVWSWGKLYVESYRLFRGVRVIFKDSAGNRFTNWADRGGTNQCPKNVWLRIHSAHPNAEELAKTIYSAGLARKRLHIWFEGDSGICFIKGVKVDM